MLSARWHEKLLERCYDFSTEHDMSEEATQELISLVLDIAREQYRHGEREGIIWLEQQKKK